MAWFAYKGFTKGLIIELASLAALVLGIYAALYFSDITADFLVTYLKVGKKYLSLIAFVLTFILVVIGVVTLGGRILEKFIDILLLGFLNKLAGAVFGVLKGMLILSLLLMLMNYIGAGNLLDKKNPRKFTFL